MEGSVRTEKGSIDIGVLGGIFQSPYLIASFFTRGRWVVTPRLKRRPSWIVADLQLCQPK